HAPSRISTLSLHDALPIYTAWVSDANGNAIECYTYTRFGNVSVHGPGGAPRPAPSYDVRHLFNGQVYYPQIYLYDYRRRMYSPTDRKSTRLNSSHSQISYA